MATTKDGTKLGFWQRIKDHPAMTLLATLCALVTVSYFLYDRFSPNCKTQISQAGLKWNNDDFSEATRTGNLPIVKAYLCGGMSPSAYYGDSDRFVLVLPLTTKVDNFPEILKLFTDSGIAFKTKNTRHENDWFFAEESTPETLEDQLFFQIATTGYNDLAAADASALITSHASPERLINEAKKHLSTPGADRHAIGYSHIVLEFFTKLNSRPFIP